MNLLQENLTTGKNSITAFQWIRKNCCLHPSHDLVNASLYLGSLGMEFALKLLDQVRSEHGAKHSCKHCPDCGNRYSVH